MSPAETEPSRHQRHRDEPSDASLAQRTNAFMREHNAAALTSASIILIAAAWFFESSGMMPYAVPLYVAGFIAGGYLSATKGITTLINERDLDVDLLMVVAAIGAAAIGYWVDGAILILIFAFSGTLEGYALRRTNRDIASLMKLRPETATLLSNGTEQRVRVEDLVAGDIVLIRAGERIPADGEIRAGFSSVNEASITGESIPDEKNVGSQVFAGTINGQGTLKVIVTAATEASLLARLIKMVQEARSEKPATQLFIEQFERRYARFVVAGAVLAGTLPPFILGWTWNETVYRAMIFLVVASPCALVASMMPAILSGISNGARHGILFKGGMHLENIGDLKVIAFDKTGTLTHGHPQVTDILAISERRTSPDQLIALAASLERWSDHPLARAIVAACEARGLSLQTPADVQEIAGFGLSGKIDGTSYFIGRPDFLERQGIAFPDEAESIIHRLEGDGKAIAVIAKEHDVIGIYAFQDSLREDVSQIIHHLKRLGIEKVVMLTGDTKRSGEALGSKAGCDEVYASLVPEDKVRIIKELTARYKKVAMVGDGVNDAPALASASVGIAMGGAGTDVALETADVVLVSDDLAKLPYAITLGRRTKRIVRQNIALALSIITILIIANFLEMITLPIGVVGHEGSTVLVILNGLRMLR